MSLLMPELERQLRAAIRSGKVTGATEDAATGQTGPRRFVSSSAVLTLACTLTTLAVLAVILVSVHGSRRAVVAHRPETATGVARSAFPRGTWCAEPVPWTKIAPNPTVLARSDRAGWVVARATVSLPGIPRFTGLVFDLGGQVYLLCGASVPNLTQVPGRNVFWTLTDDRPAPAGHDRLTIAGVSESSIARKLVDGGTFYVAFLPGSMCHNRSLTAAITGPVSSQSFTVPMPKCLPADSPSVIPITPPARLSAQQRNEFHLGDVTFADSGCLACHQLAGHGNNGPGPNLTGIGSRLSNAQLAHALTNPTAPMPSFRGLAHNSPKAFAALLYFLSKLSH